MSEDEGTNSSAQSVPSEEQSDDGEMIDGDSASVDADGLDAESAPAGDAESDGDDSSVGAADTVEESDGEPSAPPQTSEDIQELLDDVTEYDDELAHQVSAIVDEARDLNGTVAHQHEELEDLSERVEEQAETIGELQDELETREEQVEEHEETVEDLKSRLKRKQADFQNYKKRAKKRQQQIKDRATEDLVERLLGVRDNLKRALEEDSDDAESLRQGVEMTKREFDRILEDENVSEIDPDPGTATDPQRHEVMMQVDSAQPEGTVADVYTPGYEMGDKVIQNAQVTVSNGELEAEEETTPNESGDDGENGGEETEEASETSDADADSNGDGVAADDAEKSADGEDEEPAIELGGDIASDESANAEGDSSTDSDETAN